MIAVYLIVMGIILLGHNMTLLGIISLVVGLFASRDSERIWSIILGAILLLSTSWVLAGVIGVLLGLLADKRR
jgi:hypothetical protein